MSEYRRRVISQITNERQRQDDKWGGPAHDNCLDDAMWFIILSKRMGRIAEVMLDCGFDESNDDTEAEVVKAAAVAVAWLESRARGTVA